MLVPVFLYPQDTEEPDVSILKRGPIQIQGLDFLPPNALPADYGLYDYAGSEVSVYFLRREIVPNSTWQKDECGGYSLWVLDSDVSRVFFYQDSNGWSVFIEMDPDVRDTCKFTGQFLRRLRYFLGISRDTRTVSFPAVLEFS